jgi:hypothetical protein
MRYFLEITLLRKNRLNKVPRKSCKLKIDLLISDLVISNVFPRVSFEDKNDVVVG